MKGFYKHDNSEHIFIEFLREVKADRDKITFVATWWHKAMRVGKRKPWEIRTENVVIYREHLNKWKPCDENGEEIEHP